MGLLQYAGLYIQLNAALNDGHGEVDNHISGNGKLCYCVCLLEWESEALIALTLKCLGGV